MKFLKILFVVGILSLSQSSFAQSLPPSFQTMLSEVVKHFETIITGNSLTKGSSTISVLSEDRVALKIKHKGKVKNLTFVTEKDEENNSFWVAANPLTIDMVNKYEKDLTKVLETMHAYSEKKSQE